MTPLLALTLSAVVLGACAASLVWSFHARQKYVDGWDRGYRCADEQHRLRQMRRLERSA